MVGEVRTFAHFFRQVEIDNPRSGEKGMLRDDEHKLLAPNHLELEEPDLCLDKMGFQILKTYGDVWNDEFRSLRNLVHQLHSLDRVTIAALDWKPDICIFVRPDLMYWNSFEKVLGKAVKAPDRTAFIPSWQHWLGLNDRFSLCIGTDAIRAYGARQNRALLFAQDASGLHAERLLRHALEQAEVNVRRFNVRASRVRSDGQILREDFRDARLVFPRTEKFLKRVGRRVAQRSLFR
ncbi:hypothetical protein [Sulfitobacter sp. M22]|uniref:hypothetical protein n=1 Tax=Sulfitobacter sp. M22 TaxID=2675332 RepID=UPI001F196C78|nr:hypothetical protein [Sulfitobacter sp. M22]MCF7728057.1 hypothetical protein [Sulfitobacter sp. M22]